MECGLSRTRDCDPILVPPTGAGGHYRNGRVGGPNVWKDIVQACLSLAAVGALERVGQ